MQRKSNCTALVIQSQLLFLLTCCTALLSKVNFFFMNFACVLSLKKLKNERKISGRDRTACRCGTEFHA